MPEILIHYIWQQGLFMPYEQTTVSGKRIKVLSLGQHNLNAGPDFSDVHLLIDSQEWRGNVEIHVQSSDWYKHHHDRDKAYDNVILHVVRKVDQRVYTSNNVEIEQCELNYPMGSDYVQMMVRDAQQMDQWAQHIHCSQMLLTNPALLRDGWKRALMTMRLGDKEKAIQRLLTITNNSWENAFYITLAHNFGFHVNGIPFEQLALATPLVYLQKHKNNLFQLEAILLGQSGLLTDESAQKNDEQDLWKEYLFLKAKFDLHPIPGRLWKRLRLRPQNFPEIRIRQFAQLLHQSEFLFSKLINAETINEMVNLFRLPAPSMGLSSIYVLLINTVIPYLYARGHREKALTLLEAIPAENNSIIRQWKLLGQEIKTALDSQSLIHLYQHFCLNDQCLNCDIGFQVFINNN